MWKSAALPLWLGLTLLCVSTTAPAAQTQAGTCVDTCAGVVCPGGGACVNGACQMGTGGTMSGVGNDGPIDFGGGLNLGGKDSGSGGNGRISKDPGCACALVGASPAGGAAIFLAGLAASVALGRRRRRAA